MDASNRNLFYRELIDSYAKRPRTFVISTHLIEEIQNLIENVVIVADHRIILDDSVENILSKAHFVSGTKDDAGKYVEGLRIIGSEFLGNTVGYYVYDELDDGRVLPDTVYLDSFDLNKLFLCLTESGEIVMTIKEKYAYVFLIRKYLMYELLAIGGIIIVYFGGWLFLSGKSDELTAEWLMFPVTDFLQSVLCFFLLFL